MTRTQRVGGWALLAYGALSVGATALIGVAVSLGLEDGDDPADGLRFFRDHGDVYVLSGITLFFMAVSLTVAVLGLDDVLADRANRLARRSVTTSGLFASAFLAVAGIFQISAPGPVLRIAEFGEADGRAAYLVVQLAGTQVALAGGLFTVGIWVVGMCVLGGRQRLIPLPLAWLGVIPGFRVVAGLFGPLLDNLSSVVWVVYMLAVVGTSVWFLLAGGWLVVRSRTARSEVAAS
ncbi:MAG TPA: DUF4386 family protein [Actinomycetes bacterium]|nr:DUF4386 family protein [Actinomycetes bacterium]